MDKHIITKIFSLSVLTFILVSGISFIQNAKEVSLVHTAEAMFCSPDTGCEPGPCFGVEDQCATSAECISYYGAQYSCVPSACGKTACECQPNCSGKVCGPDGCGGFCGSLGGNCQNGETCTGSGTCVAQAAECPRTDNTVVKQYIAFSPQAAANGAAKLVVSSASSECPIGTVAPLPCSSYLDPNRVPLDPTTCTDVGCSYLPPVAGFCTPKADQIDCAMFDETSCTDPSQTFGQCAWLPDGTGGGGIDIPYASVGLALLPGGGGGGSYSCQTSPVFCSSHIQSTCLSNSSCDWVDPSPAACFGTPTFKTSQTVELSNFQTKMYERNYYKVPVWDYESCSFWRCTTKTSYTPHYLEGSCTVGARCYWADGCYIKACELSSVKVTATPQGVGATGVHPIGWTLTSSASDKGGTFDPSLFSKCWGSDPNGTYIAAPTCCVTGVSCPAPKIDGICDYGQIDHCIQGSSSNLPDDADNYIWQCNGSGGGASPVCTVPKGTPPVVNISASPASIPYNSATTISWSSLNASWCNITKEGVAFDSTLNGSRSSGNLTVDTIFSITCGNATGNSSASVTVTVGGPPIPPPTVSIYPDSASIPYNGSTMLNWSSTDAVSCTIRKAGAFFSNTLSGYQSTGNLTTNTTFDITCTNPAGSANASTVVNVGPIPPPIVSIDASSNPVAYNTSTSINWSSINASSCTVTKGGVFFSSTLNGSLPSGNLTSNTTFGITCSNANPTPASASVTVTVGPQPQAPTVNIWPDAAPPLPIPYNTQTHINWSSVDASACTINKNGIFFSSTLNGYEWTGNLTSDTTFDITCTNATGPKSASTVITVAPIPKPTVSISSALPLPIAYNSATNIIWSSTNAVSCSITKAGAAFSSTLNGNLSSGNLIAATTFAITCTNASGSTSASIDVTVGGPPPPVPSVSITALASPIAYGTGTTINWSSSYATACSITKAGAAFDTTLNGSQPSGNLTSNTTFAISCSNVTGSSSASVLVTVLPPLPNPTITVAPNPIPFYGAATVSWTTLNATGCTINKDGALWASWPADGLSKVGSQFENPTYTFSIDCWNAVGAHQTQTATLVVNQNWSQCNSLVAPTHVELNETFTVTANLTNRNTNEWKMGGATPHRLSLLSPLDWGGADYFALSADTAQNVSRTFTGSLIAPNAEGVHTLSMQMMQYLDPTHWSFGPVCSLTNTTGNITVKNATLDVQPRNIGFAAAVLNDPVAPQTLTVSNAGGGTITNVDLTWASTTMPFHCSNCQNLTLGPGESKTMTITFDSTVATGTFAQTAIISANGQTSINVSVNGSVTDKVIVTKDATSVIPQFSFDFGEVARTRSKSLTIYVKNRSTVSPADNGGTITLTPPAPFSCAVPSECTFTLPANTTRAIRLLYKPDTELAHTGTLHIGSNPSVDVELKGVGIKPIFKIEER